MQQPLFTFSNPVINRGYSSDAEAVFSNLPNALTNDEKDGINTFVNASVASGNWAQYDYFFGFFLDDATNALTDWKTGLTATAVNAPTHTANQGYLANGTTQYVNTNINPSTDSTNFVLDDAHIGCYVYDNLDTGANKMLFGSAVGGSSVYTQFYQNTNINLRFNNTNPTTQYFSDSYFVDNSRYNAVRGGASDVDFYKNGTKLVDGTVSSTSIPNTNLFTLAQSNNGTAAGFINASVSYLFTGGGFDLTELDLELDQLESNFII
jgi:hypothetical protein